MDYMKLCEKAAFAGGRSIANYKNREKETIKEKDFMGHHAVVSEADYKSQEAILRVLNKKDKHAVFLTEEIVKDPKLKDSIIDLDTLDFLNLGGVYIIDELDGSSSFTIGHYEWSVSVGYVNQLQHEAGAVYAPKIGRGLLFSASKGEGSFLQEGNKKERIHVANHKLNEAYVIFGVDNFLSKYPKHNKLVTIVSDKARTTNSNGSCALPLGLVAAGKADALIQPLQCPWDWAAGKIIVEEAGGELLFYEIKNEKINSIDRLETEHYNPLEKKVGFIAGNKNLTREIMDMLLKI